MKLILLLSILFSLSSQGHEYNHPYSNYQRSTFNSAYSLAKGNTSASSENNLFGSMRNPATFSDRAHNIYLSSSSNLGLKNDINTNTHLIRGGFSFLVRDNLLFGLIYSERLKGSLKNEYNNSFISIYSRANRQLSLPIRYKINDQLNLGLRISHNNYNHTESSITTKSKYLTYRLGLLYKINKDFNLGISYRPKYKIMTGSYDGTIHIPNTSMIEIYQKYNDLFHISMSSRYEKFILNLEFSLTTIDRYILSNMGPSNFVNHHIGIEHQVNDRFVLLAGYFNEGKIDIIKSSKNMIHYLTLGASYSFYSFNLSVAYANSKLIDNENKDNLVQVIKTDLSYSL